MSADGLITGFAAVFAGIAGFARAAAFAPGGGKLAIESGAVAAPCAVALLLACGNAWALLTGILGPTFGKGALTLVDAEVLSTAGDCAKLATPLKQPKPSTIELMIRIQREICAM